MELSGWGNYPKKNCKLVYPYIIKNKDKIFLNTNASIPRGLGRSYGDSSISETVIKTDYLNKFIKFDYSKGILECLSGVSLHEILELIIPKGWFLEVSSGTKFITIGGAIASDIHGKNHHNAGCFSNSVEIIKIMLASNDIITCSRELNSDLFYATCGGMGLTGLILEAKIQLKKIQTTNILQKTFKSQTIEETIETIDQREQSTYAVAWIDCTSKGIKNGRSILMLGEHHKIGKLEYSFKERFSIPNFFPSFVLNNFSMKTFNNLYFFKNSQERSKVINLDEYFYPLDRIQNWNRIYGKKGFLQYQFVVPKENGLKPIKMILKKILESNETPFLTVLKSMGEKNNNYLSFPIRGYTLSIDFKISTNLFKLLDCLDEIVIDFGGRIYLAKDSRMSEITFKKSYQDWETFDKVRVKYGAKKHISSNQSIRLGL